MSIKSLTDPTGDLTVYCKEVKESSSSAQLIPIPTVFYSGNAGAATIGGASNLLVTYTRLGNDTIIRTSTVTFTVTPVTAGSITLGVDGIEDKIPSDFLFAGSTSRMMSGSLFAFETGPGNATKVSTFVSAYVNINVPLSGNVNIVFEDVFAKIIV
jgi:hypothetical protein